MTLTARASALLETMGWRPIETAPKDGTRILGMPYANTMRYMPYKPTSEQFRHGLKGRWQRANEYGGWENCPEPEAWRDHAFAGQPDSAADLIRDLVAALALRDERVAKLEAELEVALQKAPSPQWFYMEGEHSSDYCRDSAHEVFDYDYEDLHRKPGRHHIVVECATDLPARHYVVHVFTEEEKDARDDDTPWEMTLCASADEARALSGSLGDEVERG